MDDPNRPFMLCLFFLLHVGGTVTGLNTSSDVANAPMSPPPAAAPGDPRYTVGSVVGPYLLLEKVDSLPSTWAPSAPLLPRSSPAAAGSGTRLQALGTGSGRWSSLLLPDTELLTALEVPSVNETDDHQESGYPALPSPEGRPALPASFEQELLSGSRTAYRLHRRFGRGAHGEVWRAVCHPSLPHPPHLISLRPALPCRLPAPPHPAPLCHTHAGET